MKCFKNMTTDKSIRLCVVLTVALIVLTRALTLAHNIFLHPDEYVYFYSAKGIINYLQGDTPTYTTAKVYPEGSFIFHVPFQMIYRLLNLRGELEYHLSSRVAAVFYYAVGVILGFVLLNKCFGKSRRASAIYGATMVFSLFHIEQSRYGTSETLTFMFLMLALLLSSRVYERKGNRYVMLLLSGLCCGILASMKYPLAYFMLFPIIAAVRSARDVQDGIVSAELVIVSVVAGFFLVSPKTLLDIGYMKEAIDREWKAYMENGNITEIGGWHNHIVSVVIYMVAYAGLLGGPSLAIPLFRGRRDKEGEEEHSALRPFWRIDMPLVFLGFFLYNMFTKTIFMRTFYPVACIFDIYACAGIAAMFDAPHRKWMRWAAVALVAVTVLRGGCLIVLMMDRSGDRKLMEAIQATVDEGWERTTILGPGRNCLLTVDKEALKNLQEVDIDTDAYAAPESMFIRPGELVITATLDHSKCSPYILPVTNEIALTRIDRWNKFSAINSDYFRYRPYPEWYYALFGFWVKGTTGTDYEFPTNYLYYRPLGQ